MSTTTGADAAWPQRIVIDALNVAHWCGPRADLRLPLTLASALLERGIDVALYFDASAPHRLGEARGAYEQLRAACARIVQVRSGIRADGELLRHARKTAATVVSRDGFRDYRARFRKLIDDPQRRLGGQMEDGQLHLPSLGLVVTVPAKVEEAAARLLAADRGSAKRDVGPAACTN